LLWGMHKERKAQSKAAACRNKVRSREYNRLLLHLRAVHTSVSDKDQQDREMDCHDHISLLG